MQGKIGLEVRCAACERDYLVVYHTLISTRPQDRQRFIPFMPHLSQDTMQVYKGKEGKLIGLVEYEAAKSGELRCLNFYPFGMSPKKHYPELLGVGIADRVQLIVAEDLLNKLGNEVCVMHDFINTDEHRTAQLRRLGIEPSRVYSLQEYLHLISGSINVSL